VAVDLMSRLADQISEGLAWGTAAIFAIMLLFGPQLIAEDEPAAKLAAGTPAYSGSTPPPGDAGKQIFTDNCGSCHTLSAAGTSGAVGPVLDGAVLDAPTVANKVRKGGGSMPAFGESLAQPDIAAVAAFVAASSGS
jgi:mono/diheme cytochrome c family protein